MMNRWRQFHHRFSLILTHPPLRSLFLIRILIVIVRAVAPLCTLYLAAVMFGIANVEYTPLRLTLNTLATAEVAFAGYILSAAYTLQRRRLPTAVPRRYRLAFLERCLLSIALTSDDNETSAVMDALISRLNDGASPHFALRRQLAAFDPRKFFQHWFLNAPYTDIHEDNLIEWLAFGLFTRNLHELTDDERNEMKEIFSLIRSGNVSKVRESARLTSNGLANSPTAIEQIDSTPPIPRGYNRNVKSMRLTIDPIQYYHRPLIFYAGVKLLDTISALMLIAHGYKRKHVDDVQYWHRPGDQHGDRGDPIMFVHGIGAGLSPYTSFIRELDGDQRTRCRDIFLVELPYISMALTTRVPTALQMIKAMETIIHRDVGRSADGQQRRVVLIGHSYGSLIVSWMIKTIPHMVSRVLMIDPVCFMLFEADLCYNFLYRQPKNAMQLLLHFFASRELFIAYTLHRYFFWYQNVLWMEDITHINEEATDEANADAAGGINGLDDGDNMSESRLRGKLNGNTNGHTSTHESSICPSFLRRDPIILRDSNFRPFIRSPRTDWSYDAAAQSVHPKMHVFLSASDEIIHPKSVRNYVERSALQMAAHLIQYRRSRSIPLTTARAAMTDQDLLSSIAHQLVVIHEWPGFHHAQFLTSKTAQRQIVNSLSY